MKKDILIFVLLPVALASAFPAFGASVSGTVTYSGVVPKRADPDDYGQRWPMFDVNPANGGVMDAVVYLEPLDAGASIPANEPDADARVITQRDFTFEPHVLVVAPGQRVIFGNDDPANHNVRAEANNPRDAFNIITTPDQAYETTFREEMAGGPVPLACDVHPWMAAWVYVFAHRLYAVTDADGGFRIDGVPPVSYRVVVEQPDGGLRAEAIVEVGETACLQLTVAFAMEHLNAQAQPEVEIHNAK